MPGGFTLFAALEVATGKVTGLCKPRHRHQEFLVFLKHLACAYPAGELHLVMDSYAATRRPRSATGWPRTRVSVCISHRPRPRG